MRNSLRVGVTILTLLLSCSFSAWSQDPTIYVSPHSVDETLSNVYIGIDNNGHKYLNTHFYETDSIDQGEFKGKVYVVDFTLRNLNKIISCEPTIALDIPLKIMVWEEDGDVYLAYINPFVYKKRYFIMGCDDLLDEYNKSIIRIVNDAIRTH
ncbi:DUF302 domain-containing protein [Reichenbachiella agarivorans]|uniref:DUF302 domain-containing protein n=1 Tax=Reichenbachiella agarivorans TaxID=2979464 RepID=A0ABY6CSV0_9BACT|nr:DUF302 domain-containing protein [Reichenbachiella agarivorans]UXP31350.1 DUF302 domain-containing protein [Reichenbachiella agarivorans]